MRAVGVDATQVVLVHEQDGRVERLIAGSGVGSGVHLDSELDGGAGDKVLGQGGESAEHHIRGAAESGRGGGVRLGHVPNVRHLAVDVQDKASVGGNLQNQMEVGVDVHARERLAEVAGGGGDRGERGHLLPRHGLVRPARSGLSSRGVLPPTRLANHRGNGDTRNPLLSGGQVEGAEVNTLDREVQVRARRPAIAKGILQHKRDHAHGEARVFGLGSIVTKERIHCRARSARSLVNEEGLLVGIIAVRSNHVNLRHSGLAVNANAYRSEPRPEHHRGQTSREGVTDTS